MCSKVCVTWSLPHLETPVCTCHRSSASLTLISSFAQALVSNLSPLHLAPAMNPEAALRPGQEGFLCSSLAPRETVCLNPKCHRVMVTGPAPWSPAAVPSPHPCLCALGEPQVLVPRHCLRTRSCPEWSWLEEPLASGKEMDSSPRL